MILKKTLLFFFFFLYKSDYISDDGDGGKNSWYMVYGADGNVFPNDDHDKPQKALLKVFLPISSDRSIHWPMVVEVVELWGFGNLLLQLLTSRKQVNEVFVTL